MPDLLLRASLEGGVLVAIVWGVTACFPRLTAGTRTLLWWCAAAKFLLALVWLTPIELRVLPPALVGSNAEIARGASDAAGVPKSLHRDESPAQEEAHAAFDWSVAIAAAWAGGVVLMLAFDARRWKWTRDLLKRSQPAAGADAIAADVARVLRLNRVPPVHMSPEVSTPFVTGILRPRVLLPSGSGAAWLERQQRMVLCHELAHLKRADLWLGLVPALAERLFFFHPLVRFAAREYAVCREAACDAAVIETLGVPPQDYGRVLLGLGVARQHASFAIAGASSSYTSLKRRIGMLRDSSPSTRLLRVLAAALVVLSAAATVPVRLVARPQRAAATPDATVNPSLVDERQRRPSFDRLNFVLFIDANTTHTSGSIDDIKRARRFRRADERLLWFRAGERELVIRDAATLDRMLAIWKPVSEIGEAQGELGERQGALGEQQGRIGEKQGELGGRQGALGEEQGRLAERQAGVDVRVNALADRRRDGDRRALEDEQKTIDQKYRQIDAEMRVLDEKMRALDAPMRDLDKQMDVLNREMDVLNRKMDEAFRRAEIDMRALLEQAIANGVAEEVK